MANIPVHFINPFLEAAIDVFQSIFKSDLRRGHISVVEDPAPSYDVAILIGISGIIEGMVVYSMSSDTVKKLIMKLYPDIPYRQIDTIITDAMGEIGNIISGKAATLLSRAAGGKKLSITTPVIISNKRINVKYLKEKTISVKMYSQYGILEINVALRPK